MATDGPETAPIPSDAAIEAFVDLVIDSLERKEACRSAGQDLEDGPRGPAKQKKRKGPGR